MEDPNKNQPASLSPAPGTFSGTPMPTPAPVAPANPYAPAPRSTGVYSTYTPPIATPDDIILTPDVPPKKSKKPLLIAIAAGVVALLVIVIIVISSQPKSPTPTPAAGEGTFADFKNYLLFGPSGGVDDAKLAEFKSGQMDNLYAFYFLDTHAGIYNGDNTAARHKYAETLNQKYTAFRNKLSEATIAENEYRVSEYDQLIHALITQLDAPAIVQSLYNENFTADKTRISAMLVGDAKITNSIIIRSLDKGADFFKAALTEYYAYKSLACVINDGLSIECFNQKNKNTKISAAGLMSATVDAHELFTTQDLSFRQTLFVKTIALEEVL